MGHDSWIAIARRIESAQRTDESRTDRRCGMIWWNYSSGFVLILPCARTSMGLKKIDARYWP